MSQRGSFVTEYIYCSKCLEATKKILCIRDKYLVGQVINSWSDDELTLPIIAGKIGAIEGHEDFVFDQEILPQLEKTICHDLRVVVIPEGREPVTFIIKPVTTST